MKHIKLLVHVGMFLCILIFSVPVRSYINLDEYKSVCQNVCEYYGGWSGGVGQTRDPFHKYFCICKDSAQIPIN